MNALAIRQERDDMGDSSGMLRQDCAVQEETRIRYYTARSLGWEVWRAGGQEPIASFTYWDDADKWGRLNFPNNYSVLPSNHSGRPMSVSGPISHG
jgi:hypothetical protein